MNNTETPKLQSPGQFAEARDSDAPDCCAEYKRSIKEIIGLCALGYAHGLGYEGASFKFCPWCGRVRPNA